MNYVGQLAGSVLGRVRELYKGVNPATLSGSIDVVVVRQPDGSFRSSPFHVRFGKLGILHSAEMTVDIEVNGEPVDLQMRLGDNGEAFFIQNVEENEVPQPSITYPHLPHNPFLLHASDGLPEASSASHSPLSPLDTPSRRQRWGKRATKNRGDETSGAAGKEATSTTLPTCDSIYFSFSEIADHSSTSQGNDFLNGTEEEPFQPSTSSRSPSPKSDSELELRVPSSPCSENCMEWDWGKLPQVSRLDVGPQISQSAPSSPTRELLSPSTDSPDPEHPDIIEECNTFPSVPESGETTVAQLHTDERPALHPDDALSPDSQEVSLYFPNRFLKYKISYSDFCQNPSLIENPRLVVRINNKFYNWTTAAPILLCMQAFNQELPQGVIDRLMQQKMPPRSRGWWFSWRRRSLPNQPPVSSHSIENVEQKEDSSPGRLKEKINDASNQSEVPIQPPPYWKSLRLTSEQIRHLNLHSGANEVVFSVCTKFQGTCRTRAEIYLWDSADRVIVSDIDGTVTRSDALGHILPQLGKDWTQPGIVQLYNAVYMNDYKFLYCSARSVGLAEITKTYLKGVSEGGCTLPPGPLLLSPSSLFAALHREVIEKTPEHFKIACLSDIRQLFADPHPFQAAFGNRPNDVLAYREVGVPESRIFTVNPKGELTQDQNSSFKSSYSALSDLVNFMFPPPSSHSVSALLSPEFSDFSFWRDPLTSLGEEELAHIS